MCEFDLHRGHGVVARDEVLRSDVGSHLDGEELRHLVQARVESPGASWCERAPVGLTPKIRRRAFDRDELLARHLVERNLRSKPVGTPDALIRRLVGMLARKGYAPGLAIRVVREVMAERATETNATGADLDDWAADIEAAAASDADGADRGGDRASDADADGDERR